MPFCPNCKEEFVDGTATCSDCGAALVGQLPEPEAPEPEDEAAFLITAAGKFDTDRIEAALKQAGVPVWKRYLGAGETMHVIMGGTNTDVEIYVPSRLLPQALEALEAVGILTPEEALPEETSDEPAEQPELLRNPPSSATRRALSWILLILFLIAILLVRAPWE